uniref:Pancreatic progenitor cell differentiation and proliferation factor b n=1 Tax=Oryzias sinensis TaxID=183150 RepID=A0A8C7XKV7_9TELE
MAAIPAGGSLVATTDYYRRRIGSTSSSSSSCGSSEYSGEVIPHHPGLPKQDSGHWWSSFFFGKQPGMTTLTEEAQQKVGVLGAADQKKFTWRGCHGDPMHSVPLSLNDVVILVTEWRFQTFWTWR